MATVNFLLPAQTLLDLCDQQANAARAWAAGVDTASLRVSVISIAEARSAIDGVPSGQVRARLDANLSALLSQVEADSEEPLVFDDQHASVWRALLGDPNLQGLGATDVDSTSRAGIRAAFPAPVGGHDTEAHELGRP